MSDTRGVFRLLEVVENKLEDTWVPLDEVFTAPSPAGTPVRFTDGADLHQTLDTLVVVFLVQDQQWIRSLIHLIPQQQFLVPH
jgi:hypothetical protein